MGEFGICAAVVADPEQPCETRSYRGTFFDCRSSLKVRADISPPLNSCSLSSAVRSPSGFSRQVRRLLTKYLDAGLQFRFTGIPLTVVLINVARQPGCLE